jgi:dGTPase
MGDYHRTRLTHTMEVASIARTIGRALRLNEDLIEALALLHDIGHPPFGHAGEDALRECLAEEGGFSHNRHALTLVEEIEHRHAAFPGLNLTAEVLAGQASRAEPHPGGPGPLLEVQAVDVADSITYDAHDTDDAVKLGLVRMEDLLTLPLVARCAETVRQRDPDLSGDRLRKAIVHELIDLQVGNVLQTSGAFLAACGWRTASAARNSTFRIGPGATLAAEKRELEDFLYTHVYRHGKLVAVRGSAQEKLRNLWKILVANPGRMPAYFQHRAQRIGARRSAAEYVAGMTDRYCEQCYHQWVAPTLEA